MMFAETFLREFALLVSSTNGVQKLRELVLQLAVRGKLVPQKTSDGHASDAAEKALQNVPDKIKRQLGDAGQPHLIPANWVWVTLGAISNYGETAKVDPGAIDDPDFWILELEDIEKSTSRLLARVPFQKRNFRSSKNRFKEGQVLYGKLRPYLDKVLVADRDGCCTTEIVPFSVFGGIDPYFIRWCMKTPAFISYADGSTYGMNLPRMGTKSAIAAPIPLPPIAEQRRIVAKVDELMALCDELEAQRAKESELKRAAAASALRHLIEAKTQEEAVGCWSLLGFRFDELFDDLETIKALREVLIELALQGQFTSSIGVSQWPKKVFSEVAEIRSGVTKGRKLQGAEIISVPYLRVANVQRGFVDTKEVKSIDIGAHELDRFSLRRGDVLQIEGGDWDKVGRAALWNGEIDPCVHQNHVFSSRPANGLMPEFVVLWMNSPETKRYFISCSKQTTNLASINKTQLSNTPIVVPPLAEQKRIVAKVDGLMALCDRLEEQVREGQRLSSELMASMVHALTETDPDGGGAMEPVRFAANASTIAAPEQANMSSPETPGTKSARTASKPKPETRPIPDLALGVDTKFQEAVLVAAIVNTFFQAGGEPIGNFRLQKAVYFARRQMGEHVGEMAYLKKAAGPYNPSMKYSGGIAIAKQKNWLREARGRFGFGHLPGADIGDAGEWIDTYRYDTPARWVAEQFRYKKNEEWETLATVDYAIEHLNMLGIEPDAVQILQYIASDPEWRPKIEKLRLTEMSVGSAMLEAQALFSAEGGDD